jgi:hypothetical protein
MEVGGLRRRITSGRLTMTRRYLATGDLGEGMLAAVADELVAAAARRHGKDAGDRRARLSVTEATLVTERAGFTTTRDGRALIMVSHGTLTGDYRRQAVYQLAHEATHVALSESEDHGWVDEMFATRFALRVMGQVDPVYAKREEQRIHRVAKAVSIGELLGTVFVGSEVAHLQGVAERAWMVGRDLEHAVGWPALRGLARPGEPRLIADVVAWLEALDAEQAAAACRVLALGKRFSRLRQALH